MEVELSSGFSEARAKNLQVKKAPKICSPSINYPRKMQILLEEKHRGTGASIRDQKEMRQMKEKLFRIKLKYI